MRYQNIVEAEFVERPNRFIAKVMIDGQKETVHVKNTGRCMELLVPGVTVYLEKASNPDRKTKYDLVGVDKEEIGLINMDSQAPNVVVKEWLMEQMEHQATRELQLWEKITAIKPEYTYGKSRIDFYFELEEQKCLMEVKGVTLERDKIAYFPDAPTERGVKHILELSEAANLGYQCYLDFVIQMEGVDVVHPNDETQPAFGEALRQAYENGVQILYLGCRVEKDGLVIDRIQKPADRESI